MDPLIPVLDLRTFHQSDTRPAFVAALGQAFEDVGFVGLRGHGLPAALIENAYLEMRKFFDLSAATKAEYTLEGQGGARGYTGFGIESAKDQSLPDLKEFWHVGRELAQPRPERPELSANIWPAELPGFRPAMLALFEALDSLGVCVLKAVARHLGLAEDFFGPAVDHGNSILRPLHYPPLTAAGGLEQAGAVRSAAHEDINLITLLIASGEPGLEIATRDGRWLPAPHDVDVVICNVGDMLQRWTNHRLQSTTHRVVNPPEPWAARSRYSIPYFLHLNPEQVIQTLPQCISAAQPDRYPQPVTAHAFLLQRLREIGLL